jgi:hypothetical protein
LFVTLDPVGGLADLLHGWQKQAEKNADDSVDNQQLDESKGPPRKPFGGRHDCNLSLELRNSLSSPFSRADRES